MPFSIIEDGCVLIENGKIKSVSSEDVDFPGAKIIDAGGKYISPGFIDTHCHGGGGFDFMDGTPEAMVGAAEMHAKYGTTLIYPTTASCSDEILFETFDNYRMMTLSPAEMMKIEDRKGTLAAGKDADIIIFDKDINVSMTMVGGKIIYSK